MSDSNAREISRSPSYSSQSTDTDITRPSSSEDIHVKESASKTSFNRWRPSYHLQAPSGWMNDPCAPHYDHKTGLYHVSYQSSLDLANADWGDIAWRSATSSDLVSWNLQHEPALSPDTAYDGKGVFTGCKVPSRDDSLTYVYTSISALPIHHTLPHPKGSESLSMTKSFDGGKTWQKFAGNPILPSEPEDLDVTGWRDPFVSAWPSMAATLGLDSENTLFGIISGGIRDVTPTTFLYAIDANDLTKWKSVGPLVNFGLNKRPSRWSGDLGKNWEVTNFLSLTDEKDPYVTKDFLVMGTEGCLPSALKPTSEEEVTKEPVGPSRPIRGQLWISGALKRNEECSSSASSSVQMQYGFGGHLDHGCLYAANSFFDPKTSKHIVWGWITEEDLCDDMRHKQGWSGLLSLPREIHLQTLENVTRAWKSDLQDITSVECEPYFNGTSTVRTLATEPVTSVVEQLRQKATLRRAASNTLAQQSHQDLAFTSKDVQTTAWELDCSFRVSEDCTSIGMQIVHSEDFTKTTTLTFTPPSELLTLDRPAFSSSKTSDEKVINTAPELAPHTLFTTLDPAANTTTTEHLHIRAWRDNSVLEVFVNGRTAISTRLYAAEETVGIRFFAEGGESELLGARIWDGIGA